MRVVGLNFFYYTARFLILESNFVKRKSIRLALKISVHKHSSLFHSIVGDEFLRLTPGAVPVNERRRQDHLRVVLVLEA